MSRLDLRLVMIDVSGLDLSAKVKNDISGLDFGRVKNDMPAVDFGIVNYSKNGRYNPLDGMVVNRIFCFPGNKWGDNVLGSCQVC